MSNIHDFKNAPIGATATRPGCSVAVKVTDLPTSKGNWDDGCVQMTDETLVEYDYTLDPLPDPEPDWLDAPAVPTKKTGASSSSRSSNGGAGDTND